MHAKILILALCLLLLVSCSKDNEKTIFVADTLVNCSGVSSQNCLQIKENEKDSWSNLYISIEGFDYEEGYEYKLKIEVSKVDNPPADGPYEKYILLEVLEKTKAPVSLAKGSWLVTKIKDRSDFERNPVITILLPQGQIQGSTGCNRFFGNISLENSTFKVNSIGATKMMCNDMDTEQLFLQTLNEIATYEIADQKLILIGSDKTILMECDYMTERE